MAELIAVLDAGRRDPQSRSEPDVILDFEHEGVALVEVKHRSPNVTQRDDYSGWADYLRGTEAFADEGRLRRTGLYELARNWRIGWDLAVDRTMVLVNNSRRESGHGRAGARNHVRILANYALSC